MHKNRPRKPKEYVQDADDSNTRTKYAGPEYTVGDSMKVIGLQLRDLCEIDNLQIHEVLGMLIQHMKIHLPEMQEEYEDGSAPDYDF